MIEPVTNTIKLITVSKEEETKKDQIVHEKSVALVTGATGKVGSRLVPALLDAGYQIRVFARSRDSEVVKSLVSKGAEIVQGDIMQADSLAEAVKDLDIVVHLAAFFRSQDNEKIRNVNVQGTKNIADAALKANSRIKFVFASTSNVYDNDSDLAFETDIVSPKLAYPASKVEAEHYLLGLNKAKGLDVQVLRFSFVYGTGDPHLTEAIPYFERSNYHPAHRLHLVHHADIAQAVKIAMRSSGKGGEIYNVADDAPITIQEALRITHQTAKLPDPKSPLTNPWIGILDTSKIRAIGFRPLLPSIFIARHLNVL
jgi:nucleoside-diphosphate-sugar epimerase